MVITLVFLAIQNKKASEKMRIPTARINEMITGLENIVEILYSFFNKFDGEKGKLIWLMKCYNFQIRIR